MKIHFRDKKTADNLEKQERLLEDTVTELETGRQGYEVECMGTLG